MCSHRNIRPLTFLGVLGFLLCTLPVFVLAGGVFSSGRSRDYSKIGRGRGEIDSGMMDIASASSIQEGLLHGSIAQQLPSKLLVSSTPNLVLEQSAAPLQAKLRQLGYPDAKVTVHDVNYRDMQKVQDKVLDQMKRDSGRRQFVPIFDSGGVASYAMSLKRPSGAAWPKSVGRVAGKDSVSKAAIMSVYMSGQGEEMSRSIVLHGIAKVKHANNLHQPPIEVQQQMYDIKRMLHL
ncbi:uncharacterized protein UMAG_05299 [Mycosarcoma maydis]|uniref:Uncharacterized protein n=2 Tax=Mycosarcoma maydis TaxID=5270 RepID=A0A0D1DPC0_MYCMD|nr:uncharacterized protein UMAG_05299 [Ustilago maydis 521]KIS66299.1 hypothetical protein UMAG_05299 [Ustilago maydis 521]|eukprot:XP_011392012.1 hypothetical protein UMAG_05299 [Ustilago maydis 521]